MASIIREEDEEEDNDIVDELQEKDDDEHQQQKVLVESASHTIPLNDSSSNSSFLHRSGSLIEGPFAGDDGNRSVESIMSMPEDLALATAAVVHEAVTKRSDSVLTAEYYRTDTSSDVASSASGGAGSGTNGGAMSASMRSTNSLLSSFSGINPVTTPRHRNPSNAYMEDSSVEAVQQAGEEESSPPQLLLSGEQKRREFLNERPSSATIDGGVSFFSEFTKSISFDEEGEDREDNDDSSDVCAKVGERMAGQETEDVDDDMEEEVAEDDNVSDEPMSTSDMFATFQEAGILPCTFQDLMNLWRHSEEDLVHTLARVRHGGSLENTKSSTFSYNIRRNKNLPSEEIFLMHAIVCNVCSPPPTLDMVAQILALERAQLGKDWRDLSEERAWERKALSLLNFSSGSLDSNGVGATTNRRAHPPVDLPMDVCVSVAESLKRPISHLLTRQPSKLLLRLPHHFQLAFFRLLIRLLTSETDDEYNEESLLSCEWWEREVAREESPFSPGKGHDSMATLGSEQHSLPSLQEEATTSASRGEEHVNSQHDSHLKRTRRMKREARDRHRRRQGWLMEKMGRSSKRIQATKRRNQTYSMVRFRVGWRGSTSVQDNEAVSDLLKLFQLLLDRPKHHHLLAPVSRLLGLLCSAGIQVSELQQVLAMASDKISKEETSTPLQRCGLDRLLLIRALTTAADGASTTSMLVGKASPRYFFTFREGRGLTREIKSLQSWPFRNDFGMAVWFRAETFRDGSSKASSGDESDDKDDVAVTKLLSVRTPDGGGVEITLEPLDGDRTATVIVVAAYDSNPYDDEEKRVNKVQLKGCVLLPCVWYHLAIRHTRSRLKGVFSLSARQQLSILLDGKVMHSDDLKFPDISYSDPDGQSSGGLLGLRRAQNAVSVKIEFASNFEGQTGALYLFNDNVATSTLKALYEVTAGTKGVVKQEKLEDTSRGDATRRASVVEIASVDAEEIAMTSSNRTKDDRLLSATDAMIVDLGEGDGQEQMDDFPIELSQSSLASKLWLAWDPKRSDSGVALDLHAGAHVAIDTDEVQPWYVDGAKSVIASVGGIQALLPIFRSVLDGTIEGNTESMNVTMFDWRIVYAMIPNLIHMLSSFLRDHDENAREILRCGAIDIVEHHLLGNRTNPNKGYSTLIGSVSLFQGLASMVVDSLVELRLACSQYDVLETTIFSRLFFNTTLWFGEDESFVGASLHANLFPLLASVACTSPKKVRDCVGVRRMIESLGPYIDVSSVDTGSPDPVTELFDRCPESELDRKVTLTLNERKHIVDVVMGIVINLLSQGTTVHHLLPFVNFISYNADFEWERATQDVNEGRDPEKRDGKRALRHYANLRACASLAFLLRGRPVVKGLMESLEDIFGDAEATASWLLCAIVNSHDDEIRSFGIHCLSDFLDIVSEAAEPKTIGSKESSTDETRVAPRLSMNLVSGLVSMGTGNVLSSVILNSEIANVGVIYKLLWHLLKCHRTRLGRLTYSALLCMQLKDRGVVYETKLMIQEFIVMDEVLHKGYMFDLAAAARILDQYDRTPHRRLRMTPSLSMILRLLRFLENKWKEQWLLDLVELASLPENLEQLAGCQEWQPSIFHLISDTVEELEARSKQLNSNSEKQDDKASLESEEHLVSEEEESANVYESSPETRFSLGLQLYTLLLSHVFRKGGETALQTLEQTASLQRVCVNGPEVLLLVINHILTDLTINGTIDSLSLASDVDRDERNWQLKESARVVTNAILTNRGDGSNGSSALKQWRCLRHLVSIAGSMVCRSGLTVAKQLNDKDIPKIFVDYVSRGVMGIRLDEHNVTNITATDFLDISQYAEMEGDSARRVALSVAAQTLSVLDAFIFPESLDASSQASQLHGLALVRSNESRLGVAQGPLLATLVRLSLVLMTRMEPSSVKYLQCCSRLRCFLHWSLELIRESIALAGYSAAFHDLTAPLDRLVLATVLQCQRESMRCSMVLKLIQSPSDQYFGTDEQKKKNKKRLLRIGYELREISLACFRGRIEVMRTAFRSDAFDELQRALEQPSPGEYRGSLSKETVVRAFLSSRWVSDFVQVSGHDSGLNRDNSSPRRKLTSQRGSKAIEELASDADLVLADFDHALNASFNLYCEDQRKWAETDAVRDVEYEGDTLVKKFSGKHRLATAETSKLLLTRSTNAQSRWKAVEGSVINLWNSDSAHWRLPTTTDRLNRRILLVRNLEFNDHADASYELMLGLERERANRERLERKEKAKQLWALVKRNQTAFTPNTKTDDVDAELDETSVLPEDEEGVDDGEEANEEDNASAERVTKTISRASSFDSFESIVNSDAQPELEETDEDAWAKVFIWSETEAVVARFEKIMIVTLQTLMEGQILLTSHGLYFKQTGNVINVMTKEADESKKEGDYQNLRWRLSRLTEIHGRRFMLRGQAIELFFSDSHELFLNFENGSRERDRFHAKLRNSCQVPLLWSPKSLNPRIVFKKSKLTQLWRKDKLTNFEYLMQINKLAGRTFNDITQYPVFPWILADYTSEELDLSDPRTYRDLTKPVGALNEDRLAGLIERYNDLVAFGFSENEKFLYGSHYSSPGVVLHYLIRQEPFTTMAVELQSGRFDCPDRLFFDLEGCWRSCNTSTSDVKELVPELFTCTEILVNTNKFPLGKTQDRRPIDNVGLPPWAKGSPHEFIRMHRLALESEYVSKNLNHWIDLVFGFKQRGPEAEAAHNVFHYLSYEGAVDLDKITDEVDRKATESHIQNFGQTPSQLLVKEPHPSKLSGGALWKPLVHDDNVAKNLRCHTPLHQFGGKKKGGARGPIKSIHILSESVLAVYSDMTVGTYRFSASRNPRNPFSFRGDKHRVLARRELSSSRGALKRGSAAPACIESIESRLGVGSQSFGLTIGGAMKENLRRRATQSRLVSTKESLTVADEVNAVIVSCGYWDDTVKVHSVDGFRLLGSVTGGHRGTIRCLAFGDDGALMVTGGEDATCRVWVVDHPDMAIALSDGYVKTVLGEGLDRDQILTCCHVLWGHLGPITSVSVSSELDVVVSGSLDGTVCVHTLRKGLYVRTIRPKPVSKSKRKTIGVRDVVLDSSGTFVVHLADNSLHTYTVNGVNLASSDAGEELNAMLITCYGNVLVSGGNKGQVTMRSVSDLKVLSSLDLSEHGGICCLSLTPEDLNPIPQFLFVGCEDGMISIIDESPEEPSRKSGALSLLRNTGSDARTASL